MLVGCILVLLICSRYYLFIFIFWRFYLQLKLLIGDFPLFFKFVLIVMHMGDFCIVTVCQAIVIAIFIVFRA